MAELILLVEFVTDIVKKKMVKCENALLKELETEFDISELYENAIKQVKSAS